MKFTLRLFLITSIVLLSSFEVRLQTIPRNSLYFGQISPGKTPQIFAPGILSLTNRMEARIAFSPDGTECFFTVPQFITLATG